MNTSCTSCGVPLVVGSTFCGNCGKAQPPQQTFGAPVTPDPRHGQQPQHQQYGQQPQQPPYGQPPHQPAQPFGQTPNPYGPGQPPNMQQLVPAGPEAWRWRYSRFVGVMYGPIPVGIIVAMIALGAYYGSR